MNLITKSILACVAIIVIFLLGHSVYSFLFLTPNIQSYLEAQGYTPLFNSKYDNQENWKRNYETYKDELTKVITELKKENEDNGGAILKQWCKVKLNEEFTGKNYHYFESAKQYCTLNIQNAILGEEGRKTIDQVGAENWKKSRGNNYEQLLKECKDKFKLSYIPNNEPIFEKAKNDCSVKDAK